MTGYVTGFSIKIVVLMIVTQLVVYVTTLAVTGFGKIQVSGVEPQHDGDKSFQGRTRRMNVLNSGGRKMIVPVDAERDEHGY